MPPKGWRKNSEGSYPNSRKEQEFKSIDEILFPKSTIIKLAKLSIPPGSLISKDSSLVLQRSATVFVNYLAEYSRKVANSKARSSINANDVLEALSNIGLDEFTEIMRQELEEFNKIKANKTKQKALNNNTVNDNDEDEDEDDKTEDNEIEVDSDIEEIKHSSTKLELEQKELIGEENNELEKVED